MLQHKILLSTHKTLKSQTSFTPRKINLFNKRSFYLKTVKPLNRFMEQQY